VNRCVAGEGHALEARKLKSEDWKNQINWMEIRK
jgi:hypothetical protein